MPTKDELYTAVLLACGPVPYPMQHFGSATNWAFACQQWRCNASQIMGKRVDLAEQESFENWCITKQHGLEHG